MAEQSSTFTPGPWELCAHLADHDQCSCGYRGGIWGGKGEVMVCEMGGPVGDEGDDMIPRAPREVQFADARLIAASPELLDSAQAAEFLLASLCIDRNSETRVKLRAAIAKAEGQP